MDLLRQPKKSRERLALKKEAMDEPTGISCNSWKQGEIDVLRKLWNGGTSLNTISIILARTEGEIMSKASELRLK
jgi:hypothetical protein